MTPPYCWPSKPSKVLYFLDDFSISSGKPFTSILVAYIVINVVGPLLQTDPSVRTRHRSEFGIVFPNQFYLNKEWTKQQDLLVFHGFRPIIRGNHQAWNVSWDTVAMNASLRAMQTSWESKHHWFLYWSDGVWCNGTTLRVKRWLW